VIQFPRIKKVPKPLSSKGIWKNIYVLFTFRQGCFRKAANSEQKEVWLILIRWATQALKRYTYPIKHVWQADLIWELCQTIMHQTSMYLRTYWFVNYFWQCSFCLECLPATHLWWVGYELVSAFVPTPLWSRILRGCSGALSRLWTGYHQSGWISILHALPRAIHGCSTCEIQTNYDYFYQWFDCWYDWPTHGEPLSLHSAMCSSLIMFFFWIAPIMHWPSTVMEEWWLFFVCNICTGSAVLFLLLVHFALCYCCLQHTYLYFSSLQRMFDLWILIPYLLGYDWSHSLLFMVSIQLFLQCWQNIVVSLLKDIYMEHKWSND